MAAIYRYGFEGGYVPGGVSFTGNYSIVDGRAGVSSSAVRGNDSNQSYVDMQIKEATSEIFATFYTRIDSTGGGTETTIFQFGPSEITYTPSTQTITLKSNGIALNSIVQPLPNGTFIPFFARSLLNNSTGYLGIEVDNFSISFSGNTLQGSSVIFPDKLRLGLGSTTTTARFSLDDVAVNDTHSYTNDTGSYGIGSTGKPPFVTATRTTISGSALSEWIPLDPFLGESVVDIVNGVVNSYIKTYQYNQTTQFILKPFDTSSISSFEGMNLYFNSSSIAQEETPVYLYGYLQLSGSASINQELSNRLTGTSVSNKMSILEKELGGKLSPLDVNRSYLTILPKKFINQNYFGLGSDGNALYTSSAIVGDSSNNFQILDYNNLTIASGAFVTTSVKNRGLIIYVRENCVIEGTLSMDGMGHSGSITDLPTDVWKNTSSFFVMDSSSLATGSTWYNEQLYQTYTSETSSQFGISTYTAGGNSNQNGVDGVFGGGGGGGQTGGNSGGNGSSSSLYGGGTGGGGSAPGGNGNDAGQYGAFGGIGFNGGVFGGNGSNNSGGSIYLFVGKNLILGPTGKITATGSNGTNGAVGAGGGGSGGGCIKVFYGLNFYNLSGSVLVNGGFGGTGTAGGQNGGNGGSGSYQIVKVLTN
jgi:hypothetical protein